MSLPATSRALQGLARLSALFALVSIGLMVWSLFDPRPIPVVVAMSVGQVIGTLSLGCFCAVVAADIRGLRRRRKLDAGTIADG